MCIYIYIYVYIYIYIYIYEGCQQNPVQDITVNFTLGITIGFQTKEDFNANFRF